MSAENPFLYKRGKEYIKKTGGWVQYPRTTGSTTNAMSLQTNRIYASASGSESRYFCFGTNEKINLSGWNYLHVKGNWNWTSTSNQSMRTGHPLIGVYWGKTIGTASAAVSLRQGDSAIDVAVSIANLDGDYYIGISAQCQGAYIDIREIYLT